MHVNHDKSMHSLINHASDRMKKSTINYIFFKRKSGEVTSCNFEGGHYSQFMADSWNIESFYSPTKEVWELTNGTLETNLYPPNPHPPNPTPNHPLALCKPPSPKSYLKGGLGNGESKSQAFYTHVCIHTLHVGFPLNIAKGLTLNREWKRTFCISLSYIIGFVSVFVFLSIDTSWSVPRRCIMSPSYWGLVPNSHTRIHRK